MAQPSTFHLGVTCLLESNALLKSIAKSLTALQFCHPNILRFMFDRH